GGGSRAWDLAGGRRGGALLRSRVAPTPGASFASSGPAATTAKSLQRRRKLRRGAAGAEAGAAGGVAGAAPEARAVVAASAAPPPPPSVRRGSGADPFRAAPRVRRASPAPGAPFRAVPLPPGAP